MIERTLRNKVLAMCQKYPIVTVTGPRQSGKSTLLRHYFPEYTYVSLENEDMRALAADDPHGFLRTFPDKTIIDEAQRVPSLFSYLQTYTDEAGKKGMYLLSGSNNFLLMEKISQSLSGRTAILKLLPFSHQELLDAEKLPLQADEVIYKGCYPRIYDKEIDPLDFYPSYIQTYVERDVRLLKNIGNISQFMKFLRLCAGRVGQLLNLSSLANECGIAVSTAKEWVLVLQTSYVCYLLEPDYHNYAKRLVKTPKLYFYDTGLVCALLGIASSQQVATHYLRGGLFENMVINERLKAYYHSGRVPNFTFWRDSTGNEVDLLEYADGQVQAYEIKSGATFSPDQFKGLAKWSKLSGVPAEQCNVIYGGDQVVQTSQGKVIPWRTGI
jgi:predicted AAA+ superfamily ATPase